jgi:hypothetical protein
VFVVQVTLDLLTFVLYHFSYVPEDFLVEANDLVILGLVPFNVTLLGTHGEGGHRGVGLIANRLVLSLNIDHLRRKGRPRGRFLPLIRRTALTTHFERRS